MRLIELRIKNFRSFEDETIRISDYVALVGPNGCGKSTILAALNVFFRNSSSVNYDVHKLIDEDFHKRNTEDPVEITLTFGDLSAYAKDELGHYVRQDKLIVTAEARFDPELQCAPVLQHGTRLVMADFKPFFEWSTAAEKKQAYSELQKKYADLPDETAASKMEARLRAFEEARPDLCTLERDTAQFYGFTKGANRLSPYVQWVYVPAVKDASEEQLESSRTALGQLLNRRIRAEVDFSEDIKLLKFELAGKYEELLRRNESALGGVTESLQSRLRSWNHPGSRLHVGWSYDKDKSLAIQEPAAKVSIGEDDFLGEINRLGHGMQRSFLMAILQELAETTTDTAPTLILGIEEPELYQHPPQARHIAHVLSQLATDSERNTQVLISTHSPYFVAIEEFESVRIIRKKDTVSRVSQATYDDVSALFADAMDTTPSTRSVIISRVEAVMSPLQKELFFSRLPILLEGPEDVAFLSTYVELLGRSDESRTLGCQFIPCMGKNALSRPVAVARTLEIPFFLMFDADTHLLQERNSNERDNRCLLRLSGNAVVSAWPESDIFASNLTMWKTKILDAVKSDVGDDAWLDAEEKARTRLELFSGVPQKDPYLIAGTLEILYADGIRSGKLIDAVDRILRLAAS